MRPIALIPVVVALAEAAASAGTATRRFAPAGAVEEAPGEGRIVRFDLSALPKGTAVHRADLLIRRTGEITGRDDAALIDVRIDAQADRSVGGLAPPGRDMPLALRPPWYDRLDATEAVRGWVAGPGGGGFLVRACPRWEAAATRLDVTYRAEGGTDPPGVPPQVQGLRVSHRAGQTFIVFREIDDRSAEAAPAWAVLRARLEKMDARREVRYRVYRHAEPVTAANVHQAELLGEVKPMSGYNVRGRSVDQLIAAHRRRAIDDLDFAKRLARGDYFSRYHPDMEEMGEVPIRRFAIEEGTPLPPGTGLYVHHPAEAGGACYAVAAVVDGAANLRDFSAANALAAPVREAPGPGRPVLQGQADVTVFFDYPGRRLQYVQWAAPPQAHLPNQYYNWGVFVPRDYARAEVRRLGVFFHDARQRYLKPPWPHRRDTVLLAPHDAPYRSYGYGYHEALGTLRSFRQGRVRPFFARRVDAMLRWAVDAFGADEGCIACGGRGHWGGTAALQYALRRPGRIATVCVEDSPDADPKQTPYEFSYYGRGDVRKTDRPEMDAVWGKAQWKVPADSGTPIWEEMDLPAHVRANGLERTLPLFSLGGGSQHLTWKQETDLMKAYLATCNPFLAVFFWGSRDHLPLPVDAETGHWPFDPRSDAPVLACNPKDRSPKPEFFQKHFETGARGYSSGGRLNSRPRWRPDGIIDRPDRLEMTIFSARRVTYAGRVTCDVAVRNTRRFRPKPGEKLLWSVEATARRKTPQTGEARVDRHGLIHLAGVEFGEPARLVIRRAAPGEAPGGDKEDQR